MRSKVMRLFRMRSSVLSHFRLRSTVPLYYRRSNSDIFKIKLNYNLLFGEDLKFNFYHLFNKSQKCVKMASQFLEDLFQNYYFSIFPNGIILKGYCRDATLKNIFEVLVARLREIKVYIWGLEVTAITFAILGILNRYE